MSRHDQRLAALTELRTMGEEARAARHRPSPPMVAARLQLTSDSLAERLSRSRRLEQRLSVLVPPPPPPPPPEPEPPALFRQVDEGDNVRPIGQDERDYRAAEPTLESAFAGDRLMLIVGKLAASVECLNRGAMIGKEDLKELAYEYGDDAARFGLKFRSIVPPWILGAVRANQGLPHQLAATAILVWSEVEQQTLPSDVQDQLLQLKPIVANAMDDPNETVEFVRMAMTATAATS